MEEENDKLAERTKYKTQFDITNIFHITENISHLKDIHVIILCRQLHISIFYILYLSVF